MIKFLLRKWHAREIEAKAAQARAEQDRRVELAWQEIQAGWARAVPPPLEWPPIEFPEERVSSD